MVARNGCAVFRRAGLALLAALVVSPAWADDDRRGDRQRERKEEYWDGPCKVKLEWKKNGDFLHERQCQGTAERYADRKQTLWDGPCKVEREWKKNGDYKEERKCDGRGDDRRRGRGPERDRPVGVAAPPPWVVIDRGEPVYRPGREPQQPLPRNERVHQCESEAVGRVLGGIAGAVIGNQVGRGSDARGAVTIGGAIVGILIGGEIGRQMDASNQACIGRALEFGASGQRVAWTASNGVQYAVVPGAATRRGERYCRPYEAEVLTERGWQRSRATACRAADGSWAAVG